MGMNYHQLSLSASNFSSRKQQYMRSKEPSYRTVIFHFWKSADYSPTLVIQPRQEWHLSRFGWKCVLINGVVLKHCKFSRVYASLGNML